MEKSTESKNPIQVAHRLFQVLELLGTEGALGLQELSSRLELNKSTAHRILNSLVYMGYVNQDLDTLKYRLTFKICELAHNLINKIDMVEIARPYLKRLVDNIEETTHLVQLDGTNAIYIDKVESYSNSIRMTSNVGKSIPLYCSGVGKALLANMSDSQIAEIWQNSDIISHTEHTITDFSIFMNEIEGTRKRGYALDREEREKGVHCIAVALNNQPHIPHYAFSISAPIDRMTKERIDLFVPELLATQQSILKYF